MKTVKGPAIFLAQFVDQNAPFNSLDSMCKWAADLGYKGIQIPTWETFLIDLDKARRGVLRNPRGLSCAFYMGQGVLFLA